MCFHKYLGPVVSVQVGCDMAGHGALASSNTNQKLTISDQELHTADFSAW